MISTLNGAENRHRCWRPLDHYRLDLWRHSFLGQLLLRGYCLPLGLHHCKIANLYTSTVNRSIALHLVCRFRDQPQDLQRTVVHRLAEVKQFPQC
jgi:hypothetical protein